MSHEGMCIGGSDSFRRPSNPGNTLFLSVRAGKKNQKGWNRKMSKLKKEKKQEVTGVTGVTGMEALARILAVFGEEGAPPLTPPDPSGKEPLLSKSATQSSS